MQPAVAPAKTSKKQARHNAGPLSLAILASKIDS
nr:MAG TPA: hypothetical protein [Caudoviricetes sp.]